VAKKTLAQAERDLREAKAIVKGLVDRVARGAEPLAALCGDCQQPVGTGATCLTCHAVRAEFTPGQEFDRQLAVIGTVRDAWTRTMVDRSP
jgi:hypothetical protein